jgi:hypothetical protein
MASDERQNNAVKEYALDSLDVTTISTVRQGHVDGHNCTKEVCQAVDNRGKDLAGSGK